MEVIGKSTEGLGRALGGATEGGAASLLDSVLSPGGLMVIGALLLVALWLGRR